MIVDNEQNQQSPNPSEVAGEVHMTVQSLHKSYGEHHILKGIDFTILREKTNVIVGPSGSGKSVLMRQLIRLEKPDAGKIFLLDKDIVPLSGMELVRIRRRFGMVFQMSALFDSMSVFENVAFPLREHTKLSEKEIRERVMQRLTDLKIDHAANKMPAELSGGMQKRVAIARALVLETEVLVYDEPTTGLDPVTSRKVDDLIMEMEEKFGVTSIVISHDITSIMRIADKITFLNFGDILVSGPPKEFAESSHPVIREYIEASTLPPEVL